MHIKNTIWVSVLILLIVPLLLTSWAYAESAVSKAASESPEFKSYWNSGRAEITSYKLEQARYGELHSGYSVLVFVTEDFSKKKQVKLDRPAAAGR